VAIIHRATIGDRADRKYAERRDEAKKRGYKWGAYHLGKRGDPLKQADFFLETEKPAGEYSSNGSRRKRDAIQRSTPTIKSQKRFQISTARMTFSQRHVFGMRAS